MNSVDRPPSCGHRARVTSTETGAIPDGLRVTPPSTDDRDAVLATVRAADLPPPEAVVDIGPDLDEFLRGTAGAGRWWVSAAGPVVAGVAYAASERMTDGTWNLLMLAVRPDHQGRGVGTALVRAIEADLRAAPARLLVIDTSGLALFADQRRFHTRLGYTEQARIPDFFEAGDDKVVFTKHLA